MVVIHDVDGDYGTTTDQTTTSIMYTDDGTDEFPSPFIRTEIEECKSSAYAPETKTHLYPHSSPHPHTRTA